MCEWCAMLEKAHNRILVEAEALQYALTTVDPGDVQRNPGRYVVMERRLRSLSERAHLLSEASTKLAAFTSSQVPLIIDIVDDLNAVIEEATARPLKPAGRMDPELG